MPSPKKGESMEDYMKRFMSSEEAKKDYPDEKQRYSVGMSMWKKHMKQSIELKLNYSVPLVCESEIKENMDFMIAGTAINAVITSNNHKFLPEELRTASETLRGRPLLVDHKNEVDSIKGRVTESFYNDIANKIDFRAKVVDNKIKQMIKDGLINSVSVGATVKEIEETEGVLIPRGIEFKELSLVAVPADSNATFNVALSEAYNTMVEEMTKCKECGKMIEKDKMKDHMKTHEKENAQPDNGIVDNVYNCKEVKMSEEIETKAVVEAKVDVKVDEIAKLKEAITLLQAELAATKKIAEKKAEATEEAEDEDEEEDIDEKLGYKIVQGFGSIHGGAFTLVR